MSRRNLVRRPMAVVRTPNGRESIVPVTGSARDQWIAWLAPVFAENDSLYFTGTYNDSYGVSHGCMLVRNVHKDFVRFLEDHRLSGRRHVCGVESHRYRDVLHLHAIIEGPFTDLERRIVREAWEQHRGFARALPVLDRCESYVTKYALKGDSDAFSFRL